MTISFWCNLNCYEHVIIKFAHLARVLLWLIQIWYMISPVYSLYKYSHIASSCGQHGAHLGPVGPRWAPCWPHEPCYLGIFISKVIYCYSHVTEIYDITFIQKMPYIFISDTYDISSLATVGQRAGMYGIEWMISQCWGHTSLNA